MIRSHANNDDKDARTRDGKMKAELELSMSKLTRKTTNGLEQSQQYGVAMFSAYCCLNTFKELNKGRIADEAKLGVVGAMVGGGNLKWATLQADCQLFGGRFSNEEWKNIPNGADRRITEMINVQGQLYGYIRNCGAIEVFRQEGNIRLLDSDNEPQNKYQRRECDENGRETFWAEKKCKLRIEKHCKVQLQSLQKGINMSMVKEIYGMDSPQDEPDNAKGMRA